MEDAIYLYVGGAVFCTSRATLHGCEQRSFFSAIAESDGREFFIDRDPTHFRYVLNHLRGSAVLPSDEQTLRELAVEADFYSMARFGEVIGRSLYKHPGSFETQMKRLTDSVHRTCG